MSPNEAQNVLTALENGQVDGEFYEGECSCLIGTIAKARGCKFNEIPGLKNNNSSPAERWFTGIIEGDTPETNQISAISAEWIKEWLAEKHTIDLAIN